MSGLALVPEHGLSLRRGDAPAGLRLARRRVGGRASAGARTRARARGDAASRGGAIGGAPPEPAGAGAVSASPGVARAAAAKAAGHARRLALRVDAGAARPVRGGGSALGGPLDPRAPGAARRAGSDGAAPPAVHDPPGVHGAMAVARAPRADDARPPESPRGPRPGDARGRGDSAARRHRGDARPAHRRRAPLLQAVLPLRDPELQAALDALAGEELIYARGLPPEATYLFRHALIQDAAYAALLRSQRRDLHGAIARALAERFPAIAEEQPEVLAHHYTEAGEAEPAVAAWQRAGGRAFGRRALGEAVSHLRSGLAMLATLPESPAREEREFRIQLALGQALMVTKAWASPEG